MNSDDDKKWACRGIAFLVGASLLSGVIGYGLHPGGKHEPHIEVDELLASEKLPPSIAAIQPNNCRIVKPANDSRRVWVDPFRQNTTKALVFVESNNSQTQAPNVIDCETPKVTWVIERSFAPPKYWLALRK